MTMTDNDPVILASPLAAGWPPNGETAALAKDSVARVVRVALSYSTASMETTRYIQASKKRRFQL